jgi:hypothetical protein
MEARKKDARAIALALLVIGGRNMRDQYFINFALFKRAYWN